MKTIRKKELESLLSHIDDSNIKEKIYEIIDNYDEIPVEIFFEKIKKINDIESTDYKLFLLLEEFYLRFKEVEEKNNG